MNITYDHLIMKKEEVDMIIYHAGCVDGFTSAFSAHKFLSESFPTKNIIYFAASHDKPPPNVTKKNVCICDFSYKKNILDDLIKKANKLIILDHHKTAQEDLINLPEENKVFRMDHSGAYITWCFFHPNKPIPKLISYVEDTDIWLKSLPYTNEINTIIQQTNQTFEEYDKLLNDEYLINKGIVEGTAILKYNENNINLAIKGASPKLITINNQHYFICHLNSSVLKSDIGNKVFTLYPNANFSAIYSIDDNTNSTVFSLRSTDERTDVSKIAKIFGGGGHRNASGIKIQGIVSTIPGMVYDCGKIYDILKTIYTNTININDKQFNIVYANVSLYKHIIARYLLQVRCYEINENGESKAIQECVSIMRNQGKNISDCHASFVWNYDGNEDKTWVTLYFNPTMTFDNRQILIDYIKTNFNIDDDIQDSEEQSNKLVLIKNGLIYKL
jgi:oligoribonuclease NrnB/cAMP/cGMP phosphodiesterase (DHH superfamily)